MKVIILVLSLFSTVSFGKELEVFEYCSGQVTVFSTKDVIQKVELTGEGYKSYLFLNKKSVSFYPDQSGYATSVEMKISLKSGKLVHLYEKNCNETILIDAT